MKKGWLILFTVVLLVSLMPIWACTTEETPAPTPAPTPKPSPSPTATPTPQPEPFKWPGEFKITSSAIGSASHTELSALAPAIEKGTGMKVRVVPEDSIPQKAKWVRDGLFDAYDQSTGEIGPYCIEAKGGYAAKDGGPLQVGTFAYLYDQVFGVFVRGDSEIQTIYDIKPHHKVAVWTVPGGADIAKACLAYANLTLDDVEVVEVGSYPAQMRMVPEGKVDVSFVALAASPVMQEAQAGPHGIRWLDLNSDEDPEGAKRFNEYMPCHFNAPITVGVESAIGHWGWGSAGMLWTLAETDTELIYNLNKWLDENYDSYKNLDINLPSFTIDNLRMVADWAYLPFHEGTVKYMKEKGLWTADDDIRQEYNFTKMKAYVDGYPDAIKKAEAAGIKIDAENADWQKFWADYKVANGLTPFHIIRDINEIKALMK
jgi:TRAP-type uncharacterized transport system substrate-binding protein